ncbi:MAG: hypothetical protein R8F63_06515 [Acidimicrobiales bacterium]|nr:hypothetical protein [Acidimicrobiales bacterium]
MWKIGALALGIGGAIAAGLIVGGVLLRDDGPPPALPELAAPPEGDSGSDAGDNGATEGNGEALPAESVDVDDEEAREPEALVVDDTCNEPPDSSTEERGVHPDQLVLLFAEGRVTGIGGGAHFVHFPDESVRRLWEDSRFDVVRVDDDCVVRAAPSVEDALDDAVAVDDGGCLVNQPIVLTVNGYGLRAAPVGEPVFNASFRLTQTDFLTLADNGENAFGGLSRSGGATSSRNTGEEWDLFSETPLDFEAAGIFTGSTPETAIMSGAILTAHWAGESIENRTGDTAQGQVFITCVWVAASLDPVFAIERLVEQGEPTD